MSLFAVRRGGMDPYFRVLANDKVGNKPMWAFKWRIRSRQGLLGCHAVVPCVSTSLPGMCDFG